MEPTIHPCYKCREVKTLQDFPQTAGGYPIQPCKTCRADYHRTRYAKLRKLAIMAYNGGKLECTNCGGQDWNFLGKYKGLHGLAFFTRLRKEGYPADLSLHCTSCLHSVNPAEGIRYAEVELERLQGAER
jgi:hypothetical protein